MDTTTILLPNTVFGRGAENKGITYEQVFKSDTHYIYKALEITPYYEVFERRKSGICLDFAKKTYSETEFKEIYPKAAAFGVWAWTFRDYEGALLRAKG